MPTLKAVKQFTSLLSFIFLLIIPAAAQQVSFSLGSGTADPGGKLTLPITVSVDQSSQPSALQWTVSYPTTDVVGMDVTPGLAGLSANKTTNCSATPGRTVCIVAGLNDNLVSSGEIATVTLQVAPVPQDATIPIQLSGLVAATAEGTEITAAGNTATVRVLSGAGNNVLSIWNTNVRPGTITDSDPHAVELGMKFQTDISGVISGVRFYKGPLNGGTHIGHIWTAGGNLLGTAIFGNETSSGWQQAVFSKSIPIQPNTTYVVSYYCPNGHYSADNHFFDSAVNASPLHALQNSANGPNGVYVYGSGGFPRDSWASSNYWVDVVFTPSGSISTN